MPNAKIEDEFELTYLAREIPAELENIVPQKLRDAYLPENAKDPHIRLRQRGSSYEITKKQPVDQNDVSHQTEQTIPLSRDEFESLFIVAKKMVEKDRYAVTIDGNPAEVDVFTGELKGLVLIDFEFKSSADKAKFRPPRCCLAEVTQEWFIAGSRLTGKSYDDIKGELARYNYRKL